MRKIAISTGIFLLGAFAGPLIYWTVLPVGDWPMAFLMLFLWPAAALSIESDLLRVTINVLTFGLIGLVVGATVTSKKVLLGIYLVIAISLCILAFAITGIEFIWLAVLPLALAFYALLFASSARFAK